MRHELTPPPPYPVLLGVGRTRLTLEQFGRHVLPAAQHAAPPRLLLARRRGGGGGRRGCCCGLVAAAAAAAAAAARGGRVRACAAAGACAAALLAQLARARGGLGHAAGGAKASGARVAEERRRVARSRRRRHAWRARRRSSHTAANGPRWCARPPRSFACDADADLDSDAACLAPLPPRPLARASSLPPAPHCYSSGPPARCPHLALLPSAASSARGFMSCVPFLAARTSPLTLASLSATRPPPRPSPTGSAGGTASSRWRPRMRCSATPPCAACWRTASWARRSSRAHTPSFRASAARHWRSRASWPAAGPSLGACVS
jgi:hypothetical protein